MYWCRTGKPLGLSKNTRRCVCPAGRERTFEGVPMYGGGGRRYTVQPPTYVQTKKKRPEGRFFDN